LGPEAKELVRYRVATPRNDYEATIGEIDDAARHAMQSEFRHAHD
jgi:hypothetical protein